MPNVVKVQSGYKVQPLSAYLKQARAASGAGKSTSPRSTTNWRRPTSVSISTSRLHFAPPGPEEMAIREQAGEIRHRRRKELRTAEPFAREAGRVAEGMKAGEEKIKQYLETGMKTRQRLGHHLAVRRPCLLQRQLAAPRRAATGGHLRQRRRRGRVSHGQNAGQRRATRWQQAQLHAHFPRWAVSARERVLVGHDVRRQDAVLDQEPDQPLSHQLADAAER